MISDDGKTFIFFCHTADKARQEWLNQRFRLNHFAFLFGLQRGNHAVAMHDFFHVRRRNEVTFLTVYFKKAKAFLSSFNYAFKARSLRVKWLFELREQRVILKHIVQGWG